MSERNEPSLRSGGALFVDMPEVHDAAHVWVRAVPFAVRLPFSASRIDDCVVVREGHGHYFDSDCWHEKPAIAAMPLKEFPHQSWRKFMDELSAP